MRPSLLLLLVPTLAGGCIIERGPLLGGDLDAGADASALDAPSIDANEDARADAGLPDAFAFDAFELDAPGLDSPDAFAEQDSPDAFVEADAPLDPDAFSPDAHILPDAFVAPDAFTPDAFVAPDAFTPDAFVAPDAFTPDAFEFPDAFTPDAFVAPDAFEEPDAFVMPDAFVPDAFTPECMDGARRCDGVGVESCVSGRWTPLETCSAGCGTSARDPAPHCLRLVPSNVDPALMVGTLDFLVPAGFPFTFDTTMCSAPAVIVGSYCVLAVRSFTLPASSTVAVQGTRPLVVLVTENASIQGIVRVDGPSTASFAAEVIGAGGAGDSTLLVDGGGGGGSFCGRGGAGGLGATRAVAGTVIGPSFLSPLRAGSPGGDGSGPAGLFGVGGTAGGALQISVRGTLTLDGVVIVTGGGGGPGLLRAGAGAGAGGGGGSGGAVLVEATRFIVGATARVDVRGGGGGSAACLDATPTSDESGVRGQHGREPLIDVRPAGGAEPMCEGIASSGAAGGSGSGDGSIAALAGADGDNSGGGGGGAGCFAVRAMNHATVSVVTAPTSPDLYSHALPILD